jgi:hypothetical protein
MNTQDNKEEYVLVRQRVTNKPGVNSPGPMVTSPVLSGERTLPDFVVDNKLPEGKVAMASEGFRAAMSHLKLGKRAADGVFRVNTAQRFTYASSTNSLGNGVQSLVPGGSGVTEASVFGTLFDEQRCTAVTVHTRVYAKGTFPTPTLGAAWAVVYDPVNTGAYSSVVGTLVARQHLGPVAFAPDADAGTQTFSKSGFISKTFKIPEPVAPTQGTAPLQVGCSWYSTLDSTSGVGYLKLAADALGASTMSEWDLFVVYHMQYRSRT